MRFIELNILCRSAIICFEWLSFFPNPRSFSNNWKLLHHIKSSHGGKKFKSNLVDHIKDMSSKVSYIRYLEHLTFVTPGICVSDVNVSTWCSQELFHKYMALDTWIMHILHWSHKIYVFKSKWHRYIRHLHGHTRVLCSKVNGMYMKYMHLT
jgi:hypothetical protein